MRGTEETVAPEGHRPQGGRAEARRRYAASGNGQRGKGARAKGGGRSKSRWRKFLGIKALALYFLGFMFLGVLGIGIVYAMTDIPRPNDFARSEATIVYWSDGETELGRFSEYNRESVDLSQIPQHVRDAVIAAEDRSFYSNSGFDPAGIARAGLNFVREGGSISGGGSTITQQYVKNYYLTQDQTWSRKLNELFVSIKIDQQREKDDILASYLNTIWFGRDLYGVQTASKSYFGKPVSELSVAEGAALASILRSPHRYDPTIEGNEERFAQRFQYVLDGMTAIGALDAQTAAETELPEVLPEQRTNRYSGPNGYLMQQVEEELLAAGLDEAEIRNGGLRIVTTFDKEAQEAAVKAVEEERPTENADEVRIGLAAVRPGDGAVVAMYGGPDAVEHPFNDALDGKQQVGSTAKPFTLAAALEDGATLESEFWGDTPFDDPELGPPVRNLGDADYGEEVDLLQSMERSINTAFVDLAMQMGPAKVVDAMVRAGFPEDAQDLEANPRVTLGQAKASTVELAETYATLAAGGRHTDWYTVSKVTDRGGNVLHSVDPEPKMVFEPDVVADVTYAMTQVVEGDNGTGKAAQELDRPSAGKTGTHEDLTAWYAGFTPQLATAVSFINGEGETAGTKSLDGVGGQEKFRAGGYPARVWTAFMKAALDGEEVIEFPERTDPEEPEPTETPSPDIPEPTRRPDPDHGDETGNGDNGNANGNQNGDESGDDGGDGTDGGDESGDDGGDGGDSGDGGDGTDGGDESGDDGGPWGGDESGDDGGDGTDGGDESGDDGGPWGGDESGDDGGDESGDDGTDGGDGSPNGNQNGNDGGGDDGDEGGDEGWN
ncbi:transglycosylase domain-containing protein [Phytoactinopolyspora halotolerans]|uniref:Penicillin-binding protein n=1 Tax=Phytoactinopolyspora halotolerans TaxID=1981512 RepID=A0A6L9S2M1_9ACTN|nr:transglycosylase domain-containing protein [Phytoactinopolyspora halotolerans]NED98677.1 penicillin-binding protein [Phytoactinopolyspora halotolerans]